VPDFSGSFPANFVHEVCELFCPLRVVEVVLALARTYAEVDPVGDGVVLVYAGCYRGHFNQQSANTRGVEYLNVGRFVGIRLVNLLLAFVYLG
jgi:hypothetical protein